MNEQNEAEDTDPALDARSFFEQMLPAIIDLRRDAFNRGDGRVSVMVHGVGSWTISFGDADATDAVLPFPDFDADLVVTWTPDQFERLLAGERGEALAPLHIGDPKMLGRLGALMQPPAKGGLGARMWGM